MLNAPIPILLIISIITSFMTTVLRGSYSKKNPMTSPMLWRFNFLQNAACLIGIVFIYLFSGADFKFSLFSVIWGLMLAVFSVFGLNANLKAFSLGSYSYTTVIVSLSAVIPTLSGLFFGESISAVQYLGIALMVVCILLSPEKSQDTEKGISLKWLIFCAVAFVFAGFTGVTQKIHQNSSAHRDEMPALLITCFFAATVFSGIILLIENKKSKDQQKKSPASKASLLMPIICGLCFAFPHTLNLLLAGKLSSVVLFPTVNLCPMILNMLFAVIFFKERLSAVRWLGIVTGILSAVLVSGIITV